MPVAVNSIKVASGRKVKPCSGWSEHSDLCSTLLLVNQDFKKHPRTHLEVQLFHLGAC